MDAERLVITAGVVISLGTFAYIYWRTSRQKAIERGGGGGCM